MGQLFLVNPPKTKAAKRKVGKSRARGASKAKKRSTRALSAKSTTRRKGAQMAKKARKRPAKAKAVSRKRRVSRRKTQRSPAVSLRRRGMTVYRSNPRRRGGRRRVRRNPAFGRGVMGSVMAAVKDGAWVLGGVAGTNFIARRIPFGNGTVPVEVAKKLAVGIALSMLVGKAVGRAAGEKVLTGAVVAVGTDLLRNVPQIGTALAGDNDLAFIRRTMGAYPTPLTAGVGAYMDASTYARSEPNVR